MLDIFHYNTDKIIQVAPQEVMQIVSFVGILALSQLLACHFTCYDINSTYLADHFIDQRLFLSTCLAHAVTTAFHFPANLT